MKHISIQCVCHIVKNSKRMGWKRTWTGSRSENLLERFGGWKPLLLACGNTWGKNTSNWKNVAGAKTWIKKRWTNVPLRASHHIVLPRTFRQWIKLGACVGSVARARWTVLVLLRLFGIEWLRGMARYMHPLWLIEMQYIWSATVLAVSHHNRWQITKIASARGWFCKASSEGMMHHLRRMHDSTWVWVPLDAMFTDSTHRTACKLDNWSCWNFFAKNRNSFLEPSLSWDPLYL
jgi:hypothetical protein